MIDVCQELDYDDFLQKGWEIKEVMKDTSKLDFKALQNIVDFLEASSEDWGNPANQKRGGISSVMASRGG